MLTKRKREEDDGKTPRVWRAAIYLRKPEPGDADRPSRRPTIDKQRLLCRCAATVLHVVVIGEFVDEGPFMSSRPELHRLLELADQGRRLDYLIVSSLDRLAGDRDEAFEVAWRLGFAGTVVIPADAEHEFPWTGATPPSRT